MTRPFLQGETWVRRRLPAALLFLLLLWPAILSAREVRLVALQTPDFRAARIEASVEDAFSRVTEKLGLPDDDDLDLTLVGDAETFDQIARSDGVSLSPENVLGYAQPARRRIVLNLAALDKRGMGETGVLRHEIAHLVLGANLRAEVPLWFEEGVCQWVEAVAVDALREAAGDTSPVRPFDSLRDLSEGLRDPALSGRAYGDARRAVNFLVDRYGRDKLQALLKRLVEGETFEEAFPAATGEPVEAFEAAWLERLEEEQGGRWLAWVGANWFVFAFSLAALLGLGFWLLRRKRQKKLMDQWEEQERFFPSDPSWSYDDSPDEPESWQEGDADAWKRR